MEAGSPRVKGADWAAIAGLIVGLGALCTLSFLLFFSGPIESALIARLPCPLQASTNDCFASHPKYYRWETGGPYGQVFSPNPGITYDAQHPKPPPGGYVLINDPEAIFRRFWIGSIVAGAAALVLGALALVFKSRLRWVACSGVVTGGSTLAYYFYALSRAGD